MGMPRLIKNITRQIVVVYDRGKFDDWCVYVIRPGLGKYAPRDTEYFSALVGLGRQHGFNRVYDDYLRVYENTGKQILTRVLQLITNLSKGYGADAEELDLWLTVLYAGMVAEENKENTRLGKRIKRLGVYQTLIERMEPSVAGNFSRGKKWKELDELMKSKGI